ncbi:MAG: alpha/beta fold hydrolase [Kiritimatiellae bacterium]|nr:alpha/beta fold hydrolase [Kiritimatiellia bacterium]
MAYARNERHGHILTGQGGFYAWLSLPPRDSVRAAVLVCPPLVEERKSSQRAMVDAARLLARECDCAVLRIDYRGCGDASGRFEDFAPEDWLADIRTAAAWLRERLPAVPQIWMGVRVGALLALNAASAAAPDALLLWEPVCGEDFLRQLLQRRMVNEMLAYGRARISRATIEAEWRHGGQVDVDGFAAGARLQAQLRELRLVPFAGRGLALVTGPDARAGEALAAVAPALRISAIRLAPFWNSVGQVDTRPLAEASAAWVRQTLPLAGKTNFEPASRAALLAEFNAAETHAEAAVAIPLDGQALCAMLHRPIAGMDAAYGGVVFLGGWSGDRQGPHRLFTLFARQLAVTGLACLRFDFRGRGESDGEAPAATIGDMTEDAVTAIHWLAARLPAGAPITLVAICSGCKVAIAAATRAPQAGRLVLWSAEAMGSLRARKTNLHKTLSAMRSYGRKLARPETWRKLWRGQVQTRMVGKALVEHETRSPAEARAEDAVLARFRSFRGPMLFVYGGSDPAAPAAARAYERFCREHGIAHRMETIPHAGHSFYGLEWTEELLAVTTRWLTP